MKQQHSTISNIIAVSLVIILGISGLTFCVNYNIGDYVPLVITLCTLGIMSVMAYGIRFEEEQAEFDHLLEMAFEAESGESKEFYVLTDDDVRVIIEGSGLDYAEYLKSQNEIDLRRAEKQAIFNTYFNS